MNPEKSSVIFFKEPFLSNLSKALRELNLKERFRKGDKVALKCHMGEYENLYHIRPQVVGKVAEELIKIKAEPFVIDSTTVYAGSRNTVKGYLDTARRNGFTQETIGCPVIISEKHVTTSGKWVPKVEAVKEIYEADGMIVLSHGKAHNCAGFGGAIKNLGMGAVSKKTKNFIHEKAGPRFIGECNGCGECKAVCPTGVVSIEEGKAEFEEGGCFGCEKCIMRCPQKALTNRVAHFNELLADAANASIEKMDKEKVLYVNVLLGINKLCDCVKSSGMPKMLDIGMLASDNPVAIDNASIDLINKQYGRDFAGHLGDTDPLIQIDVAEELGMGTRNYELKGLRE